VVDDSFFLIFNSTEEQVDFVLPPAECGEGWQIVIDTHQGMITKIGNQFEPGDTLSVPDRCVIVLRCPMT
jgi:isoamylase